MKITKYVSIDTEIEVNINPEDFLASICGTADSVPTALHALNNIASILRAISDEIISKFTDEQRLIIFSFLFEQTHRYADGKEVMVLGTLNQPGDEAASTDQ